jgi:hypothetical protein
MSYDDGELETRVDKELIRAIPTSAEKREKEPIIPSSTLNDILERLKKLEDAQNVNIDSSINDSKAFNDLVKKVNKIEDNVNKAMGDVFERLRSFEKSLPASNRLMDFENYMTKNNEALFVLQGKMMEMMEKKEKRPSSKKDRRKSTSDSTETSVSRSSSTKDDVLADKIVTNSTTNNITFSTTNINDSSANVDVNTNTNTNDDWEVASVKTESDPLEIIQSNVDAVKVYISSFLILILLILISKATNRSRGSQYQSTIGRKGCIKVSNKRMDGKIQKS